MGIVTDYLTKGIGIDITAPIDARSRTAHRELKNLVRVGRDFTSRYSTRPQKELKPILGGTPAGGTFTIDFNLWGQSVDGDPAAVDQITASIAYNADAATIKAAIDTALSGVVTGWTSGDIAVTGGPLTTTPIVLTYSGDSVKDYYHRVAVYAGTITGGTIGAVNAITEAGQHGREALGILSDFDGLSWTASNNYAPQYASVVVDSFLALRPGDSVGRLQPNTVLQLIQSLDKSTEHPTVKNSVRRAYGYPSI